MSSYTHLLFSAILMVALFSPQAAQSSETRVSWERQMAGAPIKVTAGRDGTDLARAQADLERLAVWLDALRTTTQHVVWQSLVWHDGRMEVHALADSGIYGNVVMLLVRKLYPGRGSVGSGVRQRRRPGPNGYGWMVKVLLAAHPEPTR